MPLERIVEFRLASQVDLLPEVICDGHDVRLVDVRRHTRHIAYVVSHCAWWLCIAC